MRKPSNLAIANDCFRQLRHNRNCDAGEKALDWLIDHDYLLECGCCGGYHPRLASHITADNRFNGGGVECRDNGNRF